eukprot:TRINITY_DN30310_c0_g2_i5.p1 TRINITY_DN30310_c0_g2~~TRINITY_DN30310_c0_g2_i5.p1  ORF type:complete len:387 (+),score=84.82 TRINITY_DN30310_c0_g2_i5:71-1231(+)
MACTRQQAVLTVVSIRPLPEDRIRRAGPGREGMGAQAAKAQVATRAPQPLKPVYCRGRQAVVPKRPVRLPAEVGRKFGTGAGAPTASAHVTPEAQQATPTPARKFGGHRRRGSQTDGELRQALGMPAPDVPARRSDTDAEDEPPAPSGRTTSADGQVAANVPREEAPAAPPAQPVARARKHRRGGSIAAHEASLLLGMQPAAPEPAPISADTTARLGEPSEEPPIGARRFVHRRERKSKNTHGLQYSDAARREPAAAAEGGSAAGLAPQEGSSAVGASNLKKKKNVRFDDNAQVEQYPCHDRAEDGQQSFQPSNDEGAQEDAEDDDEDEGVEEPSEDAVTARRAMEWWERRRYQVSAGPKRYVDDSEDNEILRTGLLAPRHCPVQQ